MSRAPAVPTTDRRAWERRSCHRHCLVRFDRTQLDDQKGVVTVPAELYDLSAGGVGLLLRPHLMLDADVAVTAVDRERPQLGAARVVRCVPRGGRWHHGCALRRRLTDEELQAWLS